MTSAALQYPGSSANCGGRKIKTNGIEKDLSGYPHYYRPNYDRNWDFNLRAEKALQLLLSDDPIYDLVLLYFEQPDSAGHGYGPLSNQVSANITELDNIVGYLMDKLEKHEHNELFSNSLSMYQFN